MAENSAPQESMAPSTVQLTKKMVVGTTVAPGDTGFMVRRDVRHVQLENIVPLIQIASAALPNAWNKTK
jgi:hypothetical protein